MILVQSRRASFVEALINILIGYGTAFLANFLILPAYGMELTVSTNLQIGAWFTLVSFLRSYFIRRFFNYIHLRQYLQEHFNGTTAS